MSRLDELLQMIAGAGDECVLWPYAKSKGYGRVFAAGETRRAHVVACELTHGPKPEGREVAHSCGGRSCVNPNHLRWATAAENSADRIAHGRVVTTTEPVLNVIGRKTVPQVIITLTERAA